MIPPPAGLTPDDYDRIEDAVMETARGRWFLAEFARRVRAGDTQKILQAIERLERASAPAQFAVAQDHAKGIGERLMDIAFQLRARRVEEAVCRAVEREASAAYALAGEERGPAFAREFEPPKPEPLTIEALTIEARHAPASPREASGLSFEAPRPRLTSSERAAFDRLGASLGAPAQGGLSLDEIERLPPVRRLGLFA
jgi:hypothetical protein